MRGQFSLSYFAGSCWALEPRRFETYALIVRGWARGERASIAVMADVRADVQEIEARRASATSAGGGSVRVLPLYGVITSRGNVMNEMSGPGSVSTQMFVASLRDALADDSVGAIVIDVDSPGGSVYQIQETGDELFAARKKKPVFAVANCLAASAAYWLGSQANHMFCTPSGEVGSIGVLAVHTDYSEANKMDGVNPTYISAGPYKTELNPDAPPSTEGVAYQQSRINDYYGAFCRAVARGRGASVGDVREKMGGGRVLGAADALAANMICGIHSFTEAIDIARDAAKTGSLASVVVPEIEAADPGGLVVPKNLEAAVLEFAHAEPAPAVAVAAEPSAPETAEPVAVGATTPASAGLSLAKARNRVALADQ